MPSQPPEGASTMGKASRRKREAQVASGRPRWAGADGFDYAWRLADSYVYAGEALERAAAGELESAWDGVADALNLRINLLDGQVGTLGSLGDAVAGDRGESRFRPVPAPPGAALPGPDLLADRASAIAAGVDLAKNHLAYGAALRALATDHREALRRSTPILFDPLSTPGADSDLGGVRLPFGCVTCDFLTQRGMSMPIQAAADLKNSEWVGLVAATLQEQGEGIIDVWPVVKVLSASRPDDAQSGGKCLLFGRARFGAELGDPPDGMRGFDFESASVWAIDDTRTADEAEATRECDPIWALLWIVKPAQAAISALRLLEAVNVDLAPADLSRAERRRAARVGADVPLEVVIRTSRRESATPSTGSVEWQHRWTVRGHWKHFTKGPVFNANSRKRVYDAAGNECVKVWCPPFVKGPDDKPLVLKARRIDHERVGVA